MYKCIHKNELIHMYIIIIYTYYMEIGAQANVHVHACTVHVCESMCV